MKEQLRTITPDMLAPDPFHPSFIDFEKDISAAPVSALTIIAVNALVFAWELSVGALRSTAAIVAAGADYGRLVFSGESWRLVTGMFLHAGFGHIIGNCAALYVLGLVAEQAWGRFGAFKIYFISGLSASMLSALLQPKPSVGASGAIFGLLGAAIVFFARHKSSFRERDRRIGVVLLVWGALQILLGWTDPIIDNWNHLGGLCAGVMLGLVTPSRLFGGRASVEP